MTDLVVNQVDVAKLKIEPGELLIITVKGGPITMEVAERIKAAFKTAFEVGGAKVPTILVIDDKVEARIIRASDINSGTE